MSLIGRLREKWKNNLLRRSIGITDTEGDRPVIDTQWGQVSEEHRLQAAINMKLDPEKKKAVEDLLIARLGSHQAGMDEARRRYPECYKDDEDKVVEDDRKRKLDNARPPRK